MRRYLWFFFLAIFVLLSSGLALAQDEMQDVYCGTLSEQDCDLVVRSQHFAMTSARVDFTIDMNITAEDETVALSMNGSGAFVADPDMAASMLDMKPAISTMEQLELAVDLMRGLDGELSLSITVPESIAELPSGVESLDLEIKLVDGVGYLNLDTLAPLMGEAGETNQMQGWAGLDIVGLFDAVMEEHPEIFEAMGSSTQTIDPELLAQFQNPERIKDYVDIQRTSADDAPIVVFETTVDLGSMVEDPAFTQIMLQAMEAQIESQPGLSEEERQQAVDMSLNIVKHMTVQVTELIERETAAPVNAAVTVGFDNSAQPADEFGLTAMDINITVAFDDVNAVDSIDAPEDANVLPVETLLQMWDMQTQSQ